MCVCHCVSVWTVDCPCACVTVSVLVRTVDCLCACVIVSVCLGVCLEQAYLPLGLASLSRVINAENTQMHVFTRQPQQPARCESRVAVQHLFHVSMMMMLMTNRF